MKRVLMLLVVIIGLGLVGTALAQKGDTTRGAKVVGKMTPFQFSGVVKSVDVAAKTIVVTTPKRGDMTLRLDRAKLEGAYTGAENVKVGDRVKGGGQTVDANNWVGQVTKVEAAEK